MWQTLSSHGVKSHENIKFVNRLNYICMVWSHRMERYKWTHFNNKSSLFWMTDLLSCWNSWSRGSRVGWNKGSEFVNKLQKFSFAHSTILLPIFFWTSIFFILRHQRSVPPGFIQKRFFSAVFSWTTYDGSVLLPSFLKLIDAPSCFSGW